MHTQKLYLPGLLTSKPKQPPYAFLLILGLLCMLVSLSHGCASTTRRDVLSKTLLTVDTARAGFVAWDDAHQQDLVQQAPDLAQGTAALEDYRKRRAPVLLAFELTYQAIAMAALAEDEGGVTLAKRRLQQLLELIRALAASSE